MNKKFDVRSDVQDRILAAIKSGQAPWQKLWATGGPLAGEAVLGGLPRSAASGKLYRGINVWLLGMTPYENPWWLTKNEIVKRGGSFRGQSPTKIVFYKVVDKKDDEGQVVDRYFFLKYFHVWNAEQIEGGRMPEVKTREEVLEGSDFDTIEAAEGIVKGYADAPAIAHGGDRAFYTPATDRVMMPNPEAFRMPEAYYSTLFHELAHSTGHKSRLDRDLANWFGTEPYAKEELVAEMTSAFLGAHAGIDTAALVENSAAYLRGWASRIAEEDGGKLVISAASQAQAAADYILGTE